MRICEKHQAKIQASDLGNEDQNEMISEYNEVMDVLSYQGKIEFRKNPCQICYFGAYGRKELDKIIKKKTKKAILL